MKVHGLKSYLPLPIFSPDSNQPFLYKSTFINIHEPVQDRFVMQYTSSLSVIGSEGRQTNGIEGIHMKMKRNQWSNQFYRLLSHSLGKKQKTKTPKRHLVVQMDLLSYSKVYTKLTFTFCCFHNLTSPVATIQRITGSMVSLLWCEISRD